MEKEMSDYAHGIDILREGLENARIHERLLDGQLIKHDEIAVHLLLAILTKLESIEGLLQSIDKELWVRGPGNS